MKEASIRELRELEDTYWWNVGKRELLLELAARYFPPGGSDRVLEIGFGPGRTLKELSALYPFVYGVDVADAAIGFSITHGLKLVAQADAESGLPFRDRRFRLVVCADFLEHMQDDSAVLKEIHRVVEYGGGLIVNVPAYPSLYSNWDKAMGHKRRYSRKELAERIETAGFEAIKLTCTNTFIFPVAIIMRKIKGLLLRGGQSGDYPSDFIPVPAALNSLLINMYRTERFLIRRMNLPFGLSIAAVAMKV